MVTRAVWALTFALALVSCIDGADSTSTPVTDEAPDTTRSVAGDQGGRLAIIDGSGNIVVIDPDGSDAVAVTDDAGDAAGYVQPIWSPDGSTLAWGQVSQSGFAVGLVDPGQPQTTIATANLPFYMSWSPDGDRIGLLHNGSAGIDFNIVDVDGETVSNVATGSPFYFSWSPDADELVTHVGEDLVETIDRSGDRQARDPTSPLYLAPQWTEAGVFHVLDDGLILETADRHRSTVAVVSGVTMFVADVAGARVALQVSGQGGAIQAALSEPPGVPSGRVVVVDVGNGDVDVVTDELALGFFWSPDGRSLLALVPGRGGVIPTVWTLGAGVTEYPAYRPSGTVVRDLLPFFPQYAQSVSFWAPDSSAFAYAGEVEGDEGIWVQDLAAATPRHVAEGTWVAWSGS